MSLFPFSFAESSSCIGIYNKESKVIGAQEHDFGIWRGSKVLKEYTEILKQELLFAMAAERKPESAMKIQEIITIKER